MAAFSELGYGYKTNRKTIVDPPASDEAMEWMENMSANTFIAMMREHLPNWDRLSNLAKWGMAHNFEKNPERMFIRYGDKFPSHGG